VFFFSFQLVNICGQFSCIAESKFKQDNVLNMRIDASILFALCFNIFILQGGEESGGE
jgi:hypothetical protein